MAEGLLPHHHIIRRAGPAINKHLNLSDEALVGRLIAKGCISEKDKDRYTGKGKRARDRFIARFQNQPYELFLAFVECLRADEKHSELVAVLDKALAEYGYVPPTTVSGSHETDTAPSQSEDSPSLTTQMPSPMTTGQTGRDATLPSDVTLTSTIPSGVASSSTSDVPMGIIPSSTTNENVLGIAKETVDSVIMETSDVPTSPSFVTKEASENITEEPSDSKLKLQRQHAVVEDEELPPVPVNSRGITDDITTSMSGLSIATKEGDFPRLPFEGDKESMTFTSEGGELFSFVHKFRVVVPPNAVPVGNHVTLHVIGYCYGPFQLPNECKPCSDFIFVEMEGMDSFQLPVMVELSHNLIMESYERCHEVSICRCDYNGSFITANPSHQYPMVFKKITEPEVSNNDNVFSFNMKTFCGLCAVYDHCESCKFPYLKQKTNSSDHHQLHHSQSGEYPLHHSQSGEYQLQHSRDDSTDSTGGRLHSFTSQSSHGSVEYKDSPLCSGYRKRKMEDRYGAGSQEKQICRLEYVLLCYWPVPLTKDSISVIIFVCKNCPTSIAACKKQVAVRSGFKCDPSKHIEKYLEFKFDESRRIIVDVEYTTADTTGWHIHKNTNEIHENEVLEMWSDNDDQSKWLKHKVNEFQYPPRITMDILYDGKNAVTKKITFTLHCSGIQETIHSKNCDKSICLYARSNWFIDNDHSMTTPSWSTSSIDIDFSPHIITKGILVQVAMKMNRFELVARHLGFDENSIITLREDYDTRDERCYQMLREWWENSPKQSPTSLEELHTALCSTGQENCLPGILERNNNYESVECLSNTTGILERILNNTISDDAVVKGVICNVAIKLSTRWRQVGRLVGLDDAEIDAIQCDYKKVTERAYQMLRKWRECGSSAKLSQLTIALQVCQPNVITYLKSL